MLLSDKIHNSFKKFRISTLSAFAKVLLAWAHKALGAKDAQGRSLALRELESRFLSFFSSISMQFYNPFTAILRIHRMSYLFYISKSKVDIPRECVPGKLPVNTTEILSFRYRF